MQPRLKERYEKELRAKLIEKFEYKNELEVPRKKHDVL